MALDDFSLRSWFYDATVMEDLRSAAKPKEKSIGHGEERPHRKSIQKSQCAALNTKDYGLTAETYDSCIGRCMLGYANTETKIKYQNIKNPSPPQKD